jgi:hypothetical protein
MVDKTCEEVRRIMGYTLKPITEEEAERLRQDPKNKELEMLWNVLMGDRSLVTKARYALWLDLAEKLDF